MQLNISSSFPYEHGAAKSELTPTDLASNRFIGRCRKTLRRILGECATYMDGDPSSIWIKASQYDRLDIPRIWPCYNAKRVSAYQIEAVLAQTTVDSIYGA